MTETMRAKFDVRLSELDALFGAPTSKQKKRLKKYYGGRDEMRDSDYADDYDGTLEFMP